MNCTYIFDNTCYNENINYGSYIFSGLLLCGFLSVPIYYATRYCQIKRQNTNNKIVLIPGYIHKDEELPPEYKKEKNNPVRIV
jgi:hypothetical protein